MQLQHGPQLIIIASSFLQETFSFKWTADLHSTKCKNVMSFRFWPLSCLQTVGNVFFCPWIFPKLNDSNNSWSWSCFPLLFCPSATLFLSPPLQEEPADVREEEPHLRLRYGLHHQRHAHCRQSDAEERHGVAVLTVGARNQPVSQPASQPACACQ